jgi:hypothetical protein
VAKNNDFGMMPSLAISCFTIQLYQPSRPLEEQFKGETAIPRLAVNVITTRLPKMQKAIKDAIAFGAAPFPKMSRKKSVARSREEPKTSAFGTAQN